MKDHASEAGIIHPSPLIYSYHLLSYTHPLSYTDTPIITAPAPALFNDIHSFIVIMNIDCLTMALFFKLRGLVLPVTPKRKETRDKNFLCN